MSNETYSQDNAPYEVRLIRDQLIDSSRDDRPVKIKIYYPQNYEGNEKRPIIFWSHGLGGSVDGAAFLSRHLAENGYVLIHVQHHGTDVTIWEGKEGHPWDVIRKTKITRDMTLDRFADIPFVLDNLDTLLEKYPEINKVADTNKIGMSGHSFGALTTQVMAGMLFPDENNELTSYADNRFIAGISYSPGGVNHLGHFPKEKVYAGISIPLFHMTGTEDKSPLSGEGYEHRLIPHDNSPDHPHKKLLVIDGADHMVFAGSRGKLGANKDRQKHEEIIKSEALAYWDEVFN
ncbi:MAG: hypothetical protein AAF549_04525 [Pseudomonadota bacterium]